MFPLQMKFLICDESRTMREAIKRSLRELGIKNLSDFSDIKTAWSALQSAAQEKVPYQYVISNWSSWNTSTVRAADFIKAARSLPNMSASVFMFLLEKEEYEQIAEPLNSTEFVLKPFTVAKFQEKVRVSLQLPRASDPQKP